MDYVAQFRSQIYEELRKIVQDSMKELLEKKHLYQNLRIDLASLEKRFLAEASKSPESERECAFQLKYFLYGPWESQRTKSNLPMTKTLPKGAVELYFSFPTTKLFCPTCKRIEAYNPEYGEDYVPHSYSQTTFTCDEKDPSQVFVVAYRCQSCKTSPEVFLIYRKLDKLTLTGRSIIEQVSVPSFIPKKIADHYEGALVAHQTGYTLAGLFLLRTCIEQYARSVVKSEAQTCDQLMDAYMTLLPEDFKSRFPSFKKLYGDLSEAMHEAKSDSVLFETALSDMKMHFQARDLYAAAEGKP
jgi:hypothetical protein